MNARIRVVVIVVLGLWIAASVPAVTLDEVRQAIARSGATWTAAETGVSSLSPEEQRGLCGTILPDWSDADTVTPRFPGKAPAAMDWRSFNGANWITGVRDQGRCGACSTFATLAVAESVFKIVRGDPNLQPDFSEQHVFSCSFGRCEWGQMPFQSLAYLKLQGTPDESCYPYESGDTGDTLACGGTCGDWHSRVVKTAGYYHVTPSVDAIKAALVAGPVYVGFMVYNDFMYYNGGVYRHVSGEYLGGHAIMLIGWDDAEGAWIAKNSWNTNWGEDGFLKIAYGECGIELEAYAVQIDGANVCVGSVAPTIGGPYYSEEGRVDPRRFDPGDPVRFWVEYQDFNCDLAGGGLWVSIDGGPPERMPDALAAELGCSNTQADALLKATVVRDFAEGVHSFDAYVTDLCGNASNTVTGLFKIEGQDADDDAGDDSDDDDEGGDAGGDDDDDSGGCG